MQPQNQRANKGQVAAFASYFLDDIAEWIGSHMHPDQVFTPDQIREACAANNTPDEVFQPSALGAWAEDNGYEKVAP